MDSAKAFYHYYTVFQVPSKKLWVIFSCKHWCFIPMCSKVQPVTILPLGKGALILKGWVAPHRLTLALYNSALKENNSNQQMWHFHPISDKHLLSKSEKHNFSKICTLHWFWIIITPTGQTGNLMNLWQMSALLLSTDEKAVFCFLIKDSFRPPELRYAERLLWNFCLMTPQINCLP